MANASSLTSTVPQFHLASNGTHHRRRGSVVSLPASAAFSGTPPSLRSSRSQAFSPVFRHRSMLNSGVKRRISRTSVTSLHDWSKGRTIFNNREASTSLSCFRGNARGNSGLFRPGAFSHNSSFPSRTRLFGNPISAKRRNVFRASAGPDEPHVASQTWSEPAVDKSFLDGEESGRVDLDEVFGYELPSHPKLHRGELKNGLRYIILPNRNPADRFEAHMEVHVGSVDEEEDEQGIAHMIEHVAFLGSKKREKLLSTGARSNAYTDFHHTVFHIHSPTHAKDTGEDLLPSVLDALNEIAFHPQFLPSRVEKERKAILSELQMMNTIEYRIDCQLLNHLHGENKLSKRFPIGLEEQIKKWDPFMISKFHEKWYYPANATLYLVGDIPNIPYLVQQIEQVFSNSEKEVSSSPVPSSPLAPMAMANFLVNKFSGGLTTKQSTSPPAIKRQRQTVRPPVQHLWSLREATHTPKPPQIFQHELIPSFSINMFAKVPVNEVRTYRDLRDVLMKRIFLHALQFRINTRYKSSNPPFQSIELDHSDSGREGCTVTTLTVTAEPKNWHDAVKVAVHEVRRLKEFGVTKGEMTRYMDALIKDSEHLASMNDNIPSVDNLNFIMESDALGHTVMDQKQGHESLLAVAEMVTLEEVNATGAQVLEFVSEYGQPTAPPPTAIVACVPKKIHRDEDGDSEFVITSEEINIAIEEGLREPIFPEPELEVPKELLSSVQIEELREERGSSFVPLNTNENSSKLFDEETGIVQRRLSNGISVNYKITPFEKRVGMMRLIVCGGRAIETGDLKGGVIVGVRALSEGGCVGNFSREQVELFCVNNLINCSLECNEECIFMEFRFTLRDNGMRAAFQLLHMVLEHNIWLEDAFERARQLYLSYYRSIPKSLERSVAHKLMKAMLSADERFVEPSPDTLQNLTLKTVKDAVMSHFLQDNLELSIVGDFTEEELESCILDYLGTIKLSSSVTPIDRLPVDPFVFRPYPSDLHFQQIRLKDTDERACAYLAGPAPNRWGFTHDGKDLFQTINALTLEDTANSPGVNIRKHPLFFGVTLGLLAEIINSRLFTTVRDSLGLTYDVSFEVNLFDKLNLGWYVVSVTSTPEKVHNAVDACKRVLRSLNHSKINERELDRAKRTLLMKHVQDSDSNNGYWLALMTHLQAKSVPRKDVSCIRDLSALYEGATVDDVYLAYEHLGVDESSLFSCIGIAGSDAQPDIDLPALEEELEMGLEGMVPTGGRGRSTMTSQTHHLD